MDIVALHLWSAVTRKIVKSPKEKNGIKIITLMSAGSLSTLVLVILLFQNIQF